MQHPQSFQPSNPNAALIAVEDTKKLATDAMTDGIAALVIGWFCFIWLIGIRAVSRGLEAKRRAEQLGMPASDVSKANTGIALGAIAMVLWGGLTVIGLLMRM